MPLHPAEEAARARAAGAHALGVEATRRRMVRAVAEKAVHGDLVMETRVGFEPILHGFADRVVHQNSASECTTRESNPLTRLGKAICYRNICGAERGAGRTDQLPKESLLARRARFELSGARTRNRTETFGLEDRHAAVEHHARVEPPSGIEPARAPYQGARRANEQGQRWSRPESHRGPQVIGPCLAHMLSRALGARRPLRSSVSARVLTPPALLELLRQATPARPQPGRGTRCRSQTGFARCSRRTSAAGMISADRHDSRRN